MPITCPKCQFVRPVDSPAPDWQCPSCGVAYAKARAALADPESMLIRRQPEVESAGVPWGKAVLPLLLLCAVWVGYKSLTRAPDRTVGSVTARVGGGGAGQLAALAATVDAGDVVIYSAAWCGSCTTAKQWMTRYGFKYEECDIETSVDCDSQFRALRGNGIPYLVVKGHHMKKGFDSDEFIAALQQKAR